MKMVISNVPLEPPAWMKARGRVQPQVELDKQNFGWTNDVSATKNDANLSCYKFLFKLSRNIPFLEQPDERED